MTLSADYLFAIDAFCHTVSFLPISPPRSTFPASNFFLCLQVRIVGGLFLSSQCYDSLFSHLLEINNRRKPPWILNYINRSPVSLFFPPFPDSQRQRSVSIMGDKEFSRSPFRKSVQDLTLGIDDAPIALPPEIVFRDAPINRLTLVITTVNPRKQNLSAMIGQMHSFWGLAGAYVGRILSPGKIQFKFTNEESMNLVLQYGPWSFNEERKIIPFWVRISGIYTLFVIATIVLDLLVSGNIFWYRHRHLWRRISQFIQSDWRTIRTLMWDLLFPVVLKFHFETGKRLLRLLVLDNADIVEFVEMGAIIDLIVTLGFTWRIISWRFDMFGIFSSGFQTQINKKSLDLLTVRQVLRGLRERFICGDLHQITGFKALKICLLTGQMKFLEVSTFTQRETMVIHEQRCIRRFKKHGLEPFQTTCHNFLSIKVMRKAFRSFIYKMIACYECMKRGLNRFNLLPVRLSLESRVTSTSSSKLGFNFFYLFQWLYLNGVMYHVLCKTFMK